MSESQTPPKTVTKVTKTETEVVINDGGCKNCKLNKAIIVVQGLFNVAFIVLFVILFIMVSNLKSNMDDNIINSRTKRIHTADTSASTSFLKGSGKDTATLNKPKLKNSTSVSTTAKTTTTAALLEYLEILDDHDIPEIQPTPEMPTLRLDQITLANNTNCTCIGRTGPRGPSGKNGPRGRRGKRGRPGNTGAAGPPGPDGKIGLSGSRGKTGKSGPPGDVGPAGVPGPPGPIIPWQDKVAIHLTGYVWLAKVPAKPKGLLTDWVDESQGFKNGGFKFNKKDGMIRVPKAGYYYVYANVYFQADEDGIDPILEHRVYLFRANGEIWLVQRGLATRPEHVKYKQGFYTTSSSGLILLDDGDRLAVGVDEKHKSFIEYDESGTYFGMYMI